MLPTVKLIFSILISYPLAAVLKRIPDTKPALKNGFIIGYVHTAVANTVHGGGTWSRLRTMR